MLGEPPDNQVPTKASPSERHASALSSIMHSNLVYPGFLGTAITPDERAQLINWMFEIHTSTDASPHMLFSSVRLLDYYFYCLGTKPDPISTQQLALIGTTCMLIQSKFSDNAIMDISMVCQDYLHGNFTEEDVLSMETDILKVTNFKLFIPSEYVYICLYKSLMSTECSLEGAERVEILMRINVHSYVLAQSDQGVVAAATLYLAMKTSSVLEALSAISGHSVEAIARMSVTILEEESYMLERFG
jgi:hypothetical protein